MTERSIRRAAERKARKQARKEANRRNSLLSTGPRSQEGKSIASHNALKTALTGRTVLLPTDHRDRYQQHVSHYFHLWNPVGEHECALVQSMADTWWRLLRIPQLEAALHAKGRSEFVNLDPAMVELETHLKYEKQFRNLALQERRLFSYFQKLKAELEDAQSTRREQEAEAYESAAILSLSAQKKGETYDPQLDGFEFSADDLADYLRAAQAAADHQKSSAQRA
jgi:hypothetical protein